MATVTQAFQVVSITELFPVSLVVDNVVNVYRPNSSPMLCTLTAKRFLQ